MSEANIPRDDADPYASAFRLESNEGPDGTEWFVVQLDGDLFPATGREVAMWKYAIDRDSDVRHWKGNAERQVQLKREANARVRILRVALQDLIERNEKIMACGCPRCLESLDVARDALARTAKRGMPK